MKLGIPRKQIIAALSDIVSPPGIHNPFWWGTILDEVESAPDDAFYPGGWLSYLTRVVENTKVPGFGGTVQELKIEATNDNVGYYFKGQIEDLENYLTNCFAIIKNETPQAPTLSHAPNVSNPGEEITGPKKYEVYVCSPIRIDDYMPVYDCPNTDAFLQPGVCPDCGKALTAVRVSDIDNYLATYEEMV